MPTPLSYRAELANQVLAALATFDQAAWTRAERRRESQGSLHDLALRLAEHAIDILAEEFGAELLTIVERCLEDAARLASPDTPGRHRVARGAVLAVLLRDSRGFNPGAFRSLFDPVAPLIDLAEIDRTTTAALLPPSPEQPSVIAHQQRRHA